MQKTRFLNVDLDLYTESGLRELVDAFGSTVFELPRETRDFVSLELLEQSSTAEEAIEAFYNLICALPPSARTLWNECEKRSFNVGILAGKEPYSECFYLSNKVINFLSSINAELVFTIYGTEK